MIEIAKKTTSARFLMGKIYLGINTLPRIKQFT